MAVTPPLPHAIAPPLCNEHPMFRWYTVEDSHLYMLYTLIPPEKTPRFRRVRGILIPCGFLYKLTSTICLEQVEEGSTGTHTFILPTQPQATRAYFIISVACTYALRQPATPPHTFTYPTCPPTGTYCMIGRHTDQDIAGGGAFITWPDFIAGNPAMKNGNVGIRPGAGQAGIYAAAVSITYEEKTALSTYQLRFRIDTGPPLITVSFSSPLNQVFSISLAMPDHQVNVNQNIRTDILRTAGLGFLRIHSGYLMANRLNV